MKPSINAVGMKEYADMAFPRVPGFEGNPPERYFGSVLSPPWQSWHSPDPLQIPHGNFFLRRRIALRANRLPVPRH